jgi:hypothetical protein
LWKHFGGLIAAPQTPARIFTNKIGRELEFAYTENAVQAGKPMIATRLENLRSNYLGFFSSS